MGGKIGILYLIEKLEVVQTHRRVLPSTSAKNFWLLNTLIFNVLIFCGHRENYISNRQVVVAARYNEMSIKDFQA